MYSTAESANQNALSWAAEETLEVIYVIRYWNEKEIKHFLGWPIGVIFVVVTSLSYTRA